MNRYSRCLRLLAALLLAAAWSYAQVSSTAPLSGTVTDPTGAVVPGAHVTVRNQATGATFETATGANGVFVVPALASGDYAVAVVAPGFKQAQVRDVKMDVGVPTNIQIRVEVGAQAETVTVEGVGAILQTQSATVSTTLVGRQITDLPLVSRDSLDLILFLPGVNTPGRPRTSTINGLPKGAINITLDGINVQDNLIKSTDGFFTYIRPRLDAIQEVTISTATAGAESTGEGAVQIKFVTRSGTNEYRGSLYELHRNPAMNANYWFNNRDLPANPATGKAPRDRVLKNEFGFRVGGPISIPGLFSGRNRAFFFVNYEEFRLPEQVTRNRTILHPLAQQGTFQYNTAGGVQQVNLLELAGRNGQTSTLDPTTGRLLGDIRRSTTITGGIAQLTDPNLQRFTFTNTGSQVRRFPTVRLDFNLSSRHQLEFSHNFQDFAGGVDFLNGNDPAFPGFPNKGGQGSDRFSNVIALRTTLTPTMVNEARLGLTGGTVVFSQGASLADFTGPVANQAGFNLGIGAAGITGATVTTAPSRRNTPVWQFSENLSMTRGSHNLSVGGSFTQVSSWQWGQALVPGVTFGVDTNDPAAAMFVAANFPGAAADDLTRARNLYGVLTGRVTQIAANAILGETTGKYEYIGPTVQRFRNREFGVFVQDNWRLRPSLTLNFGLRWEVQRPFVALNNRYATPTFDGLYGISGPGNLFKPGTLQGKETEFVPLPKGQLSYNTDWSNFAPSLGVAWTPKSESRLLKAIFGGGGRGVIRAGYSIAYDREGSTAFTARYGNNPGGFITATRNLSLGNLVSNVGSDRLPVLLRETHRLGAPAFPQTPAYPLTGAITDSANIIDPNLKMPYVHSWSLALQRELSNSMVIEFRYVGNSGHRFWSALNLNEVNIVENGFLNEFKLAQANLQGNIAAGRGNTFRYFGAGTGTSPLPITLGHFSGVGAAQAGDPARYTSTLFTNTTYVNSLALHSPAPYTFAGNLYNDAGRRANAAAAGLPVNLFLVNPGKLGGANMLTNFGGSSYNAGSVELRRRFSRGLLMNANYTFSKALQELFLSFRTGPEKAISPLSITHAFKMNWIYELPVGRGRSFLTGAGGAADRILGGWAFHGTARVQSGTPFNFGNQRIVGMTRRELQGLVGMRFDDGGKIAYYLPAGEVENTIRAFSTSATTATGYGGRGVPSGRYVAPANSRDCIEVFAGQCGFTRVLLYGPSFTRFDLSAVKKTKITERVEVELRGEFLNAFNNINFIVGDANNDTNAPNVGGLTFGQVGAAYRDLSTTNDPGGRLVQFVLRINF